MKQLEPAQLLATLALWQESGARYFGVLHTAKQFALGICEITHATEDEVAIRMTEVVKRLELAPEAPIDRATFRPDEVVSAWQGATFEHPSAGFVGEQFDETLQIVVRGSVASISLYRVTAFHGQRVTTAG